MNLDLIDEVRTDVEHRTTKYKNLMARKYDAMVKSRRFNIGDLVLKKVSLATKDLAHGKLGPNWEGPYKIINCKRQGSYYFETLDGRKLEHPWNVKHLRIGTDPGRCLKGPRPPLGPKKKKNFSR